MLLPVGIVVATLVVIGLGITWFKRKPKSQIRSDHQPTIDPNPTTRKLIHEIRNPLNSMSLNLQLLAEDLSQPLLKDLDSSLDRVERIQIEIERLDQILTNFQRYANLPPLHFEWSNLGQVLQEVIDFIGIASYASLWLALTLVLSPCQVAHWGRLFPFDCS